MSDFLESFFEPPTAGGASGEGGGRTQEEAGEGTGGGTVGASSLSRGFDSRSGGSSSGEEEGEGALLKGGLLTRPKTGEGGWKPAHYVLEKGRLLVFEDRHYVRPKQVCVGWGAGGVDDSCFLGG